MKNLIVLTITLSTWALFLSGCNAEVTEFVKGARPGNTIDSPDAGVISSGPTAIKVSPGQLKATSAGAALVGNVTPTNTFMSSPGASARVGISRSRTSQQ